MTMMMTNSLFGLEDMEALLWTPSSPTADAAGSAAFHPDREDHHKGGRTSADGVASPVSPFNSSFLSSSSSPLPFYSPPRSPPAVLQGKTEFSSDPLQFPWSDQLRDTEVVSADGKDDVFGDLDWMAERVDLSDLDLDSLIGTCSPNEENPSDPDDLLATFDCPIELDSLPIPSLSSLADPSPDVRHPPSVDSDLVISLAEPVSQNNPCDVPSPVPSIPELQEEFEIKSETTPADSPSSSSSRVDSPSSPAYTLDLGSEVDVPMEEVKPVVAAVLPQVQRVVLSLSPTRIVLVLASKDDATAPSAVSTRSNISHSFSSAASPLTRSPRARPYPDPKPKDKPPLPTVQVKSSPGADERGRLKAPKNKKLKKMEQNKTAATRYRQKKKVEQDALSTEHSTLERKNVELKEKAQSMAREIEYLKELMEEVRLARSKSGV
ncbi:activating transcription factor 4b [Syngnathus typhle]|uniref:activating transcription factor 4b n=1 Tax=Syngnathus typhle TaxID=161592 RepID=UPI002A6B2CC8|nr:activating transcription factor 4b [Syngnathus typhle]